MSNYNEIFEEVSFEESPRDYRTEVPNIVDELHEAGKLSNNAYLLYVKYRRIAGPGGTSYHGLRSLAKKMQMSKDTVSRAKKELMKKRPELNGKSLIINIPGDRKKEEPDKVKITDIWRENHTYFKNKLTCRIIEKNTPKNDEFKNKLTCRKAEKNDCKNRESDTVKYQDICEENHTCFKNKLTCLTTGTPLSHHRDTPVSPQGQKERTSLKKEQVKNIRTKDVHKFTSQPSVSATPIPAEGPFLLNKKKNKEPAPLDYSDPNLCEILSMEPQYKEVGILPNEMCKWIQTHGSEKVLGTLKMMFKKIKKVRKAAAWMQDALDKNHFGKENNEESNLELAMKFKEKYNLTHMEIKKRYCTNKFKGIEAYYNLPPDTFETILKSMI